MKAFFVLLFIASFLFSSCNNSSKTDQKGNDSYELAKESMAEREQKNPALFLIVNNRDKRNILGQTVIKGTINNIAKVCIYKDIQLELSFYSKTGTLLEKDKETIFDLVYPGKEVDFKTKYFAPKGTDSIKIKVLSAKFETMSEKF